MKSNSKTPRTDEAEAEQRKVFFVGGRVLTDFARELELENAELLDALDSLLWIAKATIAKANKKSND